MPASAGTKASACWKAWPKRSSSAASLAAAGIKRRSPAGPPARISRVASAIVHLPKRPTGVRRWAVRLCTGHPAECSFMSRPCTVTTHGGSRCILLLLGDWYTILYIKDVHAVGQRNLLDGFQL